MWVLRKLIHESVRKPKTLKRRRVGCSSSIGRLGSRSPERALREAPRNGSERPRQKASACPWDAPGSRTRVQDQGIIVIIVIMAIIVIVVVVIVTVIIITILVIIRIAKLSQG